MTTDVILVDALDNEIGTEEKLLAHQKGSLHRAFSVFVINQKDELLLQQRASGKYHSANLWTNTCCSHPSKGDSLEKAAKKRLAEEMGFTCDLHYLFAFTYRAEFPNGLIEHELDHIFLGFYEEDPRPNSQEVQNWEWKDIHQLKKEVEVQPEKYTVWFHLIFDKFYNNYQSFKNRDLNKRR